VELRQVERKIGRKLNVTDLLERIQMSVTQSPEKGKAPALLQAAGTPAAPRASLHMNFTAK
jgi:hypothetical protein